MQCGVYCQLYQYQCVDVEDVQVQQGIGYQVVCYVFVGVFGFCYVDFCYVVYVWFVDWLQQVYYVYVDVLVDVVVEFGQGWVVVGVQGIGGCCWKIFVVGDYLFVDVVDLVEDLFGVVVGEGIQCYVGDVGVQGVVFFVEFVGDCLC